MQYFVKKEKEILSEVPDIISAEYSNGFVFTRVGKGHMIQTRSLRIDMNTFALSSENRRILRKIEGIDFEIDSLPYRDYAWEIHKLGKDFYTQKFGDSIMSASKIKNMFMHPEEENMTHVAVFSLDSKPIGYCLMYKNDEILHYAYPFYNLTTSFSSLGIGMMTKVLLWAKEQHIKYVYLGSVVQESSKYKLQFSGAEWFDTDTEKWSEDIDELKGMFM